jgi:cation-transporting ATPase 13A3/4/5
MSMTLHVLVILATLVVAFVWIRQFSWYPDYEKPPDSYTCYENYAVYGASLFQYIASAVTFSQGKPYRKEIHTNVALILSVVIMTLVCAYKTLYPAEWILYNLQYILPPYFDFRVRNLNKKKLCK